MGSIREKLTAEYTGIPNVYDAMSNILAPISDGRVPVSDWAHSRLNLGQWF